MSLSSAVMRAVGVGLPPSGRLRLRALELQRGRGRVEVLARVVRIQAYVIMGASTQGWWPFVNNEHR